MIVRLAFREPYQFFVFVFDYIAKPASIICFEYLLPLMSTGFRSWRRDDCPIGFSPGLRMELSKGRYIFCLSLTDFKRGE